MSKIVMKNWRDMYVVILITHLDNVRAVTISNLHKYLKSIDVKEECVLLALTPVLMIHRYRI